MMFNTLAVIPVIIGPLQVLVAILPALLISLVGAIVSMLKPAAMLALLKLLWRQKIVLVILAGVVTGMVFLVRTVARTGRPGSSLMAGEDWPMFRGGLERRGSNDTAEPPTTGGINWSYAADVKKFYPSPAVVGNRVYITSTDIGVFGGGGKGAVYCLDADTGALGWRAAPPGYRATFSSPAVAGKYLVCGEGLHWIDNARVVCMDVTNRGKMLWTYETRSHVESTPCIDGDRVYVGAGADGYYCFLLEPDADGQAQLLWHAPGEHYPDAETSPAAHDGLLFAGLGIGGQAIICLNAETGDPVWRVDTPYPVFGPPTVVNGAVIIGMGNGDFINSAEELKGKKIEELRKAGTSEAEIAAAEKNLGTGGEIWCLAEKSGEVRWTFKVPDTILGAVAADTDRLYFGARDGYVYCLSMTGTLLNRWNARAPLLTSPAISGGYLYVVTQQGTLFGLRTEDLECVWEARLGFNGPFISSPAVARGHVYVGSEQDGVLCLGLPGGQQREIRWDGFAGGPGRGGNLDGKPLPEKGKLGWRFPDADQVEQPVALEIVAPVASLNGMLYVPLEGGRKGLSCLRETTDGKVVRGEEVWFATATNGVTLSAAATSNAVYFVDGRQGDVGRRLHCLAAAAGMEQWSLPVASDATGEFVLTGAGGLIADGPRGVTAFSEAGRVLWQTDCGRVLGVPVIRDAYVAVATDQPAGLCVLDLPSGRELWRLPFDAAPSAAPVMRKHVIYLGTSAGVAAWRLADGESLWDAPRGMPGAPLVLAKNRLAYTTAAGELVILDSESGQMEKMVSGALPGFPPLAAPDAFVYAGAGNLMVCPVTDGEPRSWMKIDWLGRLTCAPIMVDSRVYIATDKKGLICLRSK